MKFNAPILVRIFMLVFSSLMTSYAQIGEQNAEQEKKRMEKMQESMKMEVADGWNQKAGIGLDLGQLLNINPYVGSGSNRLGLGGAVNYKFQYKKSKFSWSNDLLFSLSTQRIGSGTIAAGSDDKLPFEKALDLLTFNSNFAYQVREASPWAYSFDLGLRTQVLSSHQDSASSKIYLKELHVNPYNTNLVSKLFSPALITLAPGVKYTHGKKYYAFLSPVAGQILLVSDQNIANLGIHGTKLKEGSTNEYETSKFALGALAKGGYSNTYFEKLNFNTELSLFSDYLDKPQNIDVVWTNSLGIELFKGLNLSLRGDLYYDDDKRNNISDSNAVGGFKGVGKRVNFIEQLLIGYTRNF
ncbi:MAG: DUF3078 domain-containing protein [Saprospiraceae bacterium]|nr:DUF3078 domain-containing protein [Saprospiraceae bacterium]